MGLSGFKKHVDDMCVLLGTITMRERASIMTYIERLGRICFAAGMLGYALDLLRAFLGPDGSHEFRKELKACETLFHKESYLSLEKKLVTITSMGALWLLRTDKK